MEISNLHTYIFIFIFSFHITDTSCLITLVVGTEDGIH